MNHGKPVPAPQRFTRYGSEELETHLHSACERVANGVLGIVPPAYFDGLLLAGGFGCGEGGVIASPAGEKAGGAFEFLILAQEGTEMEVADLAPRFEELGREFHAATGARGIFRVSTRERIARAETTPFLHDLAHAHRILIGTPHLSTGWGHHREAESIPLHQVTHLLFQRFSGLLFASQRLHRAELTEDDADQVHRKLARVELALGDAVLAAHGQYHWSSVERHQRLGSLQTPEPIPNLSLIYEMHAWGMAHGFRPTRAQGTRESLQRRLTTLVSVARDLWLWLEGRRLGQKFRTAEGYAGSTVNKCPDVPAWRSALMACRFLGGLPSSVRRRLAHPRQRLLHALALILWEPAVFNTPRLRERLSRELRHPARTFAEASGAYAELWKKCDDAVAQVLTVCCN